MMRKFRSFLHMLFLVIIFQAGVYLYLDRVMLVPFTKFSQQSVSTKSKSSTDLQNVSSDKKYYADIQDDSINFYTADNKLKKKISLHSGDSVTYFSWVPNTELALIGISSNTSRGTSVTLKPVNLEINNHPVEPKISGLSKGSKITDVAFSTQVNVTYILIKGKYSSFIYRTDANNTLRQVLVSSSVQRIASLQSEDLLLYDSKRTGNVYARNEKGVEKMISPKKGKYVLIGTDGDDNIYIGRLSTPGLVSSILEGTRNGDFHKCKVLNYNYPVASITVNYDGKLRII